MDYPQIIYEETPPVAVVTLNRPEIKNAFSAIMMDSLEKAFRLAMKNPEIRTIILTGSGGAFSAGGNIKDMAEGKLASWNMKNYLWDHIQKIPLLLEDMDKPVIAAIDGPAFGGGFDLALACDLRIASTRATFCSNFVKIGLAPGDGGAYFLPRLVGLSTALEILLTGRIIDMAEAENLHLVNRVVPHDRLLHEAKTWAGEMAKWPLPSLRAIKRAVYQGLKSDLKSHMDYISSQLALLAETDEHRETIKKLVESKMNDQ